MSLLLVLYYVSFIGCSIYSVYSLFKNGLKQSNAIGVLLIVVTIVECLILLGEYTQKITNDTLALAYKLVFLITAFFFACLYAIRLRGFHRFLVLIFIACTIAILLFSGNLTTTTFDTSFGIINSVFVIAVCLVWYIYKVSIVDEALIYSDPYFWYTTAMFMWSSVFLLRILPAQFLQFRDQQFLTLLHSLNLGVNVISNLLFFIGLRAATTKK